MHEQETTQKMPEIVFRKESLDLVDTVTRKWAVMSQFERDLENYEIRRREAIWS